MAGALPTTDHDEAPARRESRVPSARERVTAVVLLAILPIIAAGVYVAGRRSDPDLLPPVLTPVASPRAPRVAAEPIAAPTAAAPATPAATAVPAPAAVSPAPSSAASPTIAPPSQPAAAPALASLDAALARFVAALPRPGWSVDAAPAAFEASRLYEKIDGRADLYLRHGVRRLVATSLASGDHFIDAFAYDLGTPAAAAGLLREERPSGARDLPVGQGGYTVAGSLFFTIDCYYVQLVGADAEGETEAAAAAFGRGLAPLLGRTPCR